MVTVIPVSFSPGLSVAPLRATLTGAGAAVLRAPGADGLLPILIARTYQFSSGNCAITRWRPASRLRNVNSPNGVGAAGRVGARRLASVAALGWVSSRSAASITSSTDDERGF